MGYLFTVQFEFRLGREHFWARNLNCVKACLISCLASIWCKFLLRGVSEYISFFVTYVFLLLMVSWGRRGGIQLWQSCMLMACNFINNEIFCAFTELLSMGERTSSKGNSQPLFLLEMNFSMDIRYFTSSFHHEFMLQQLILSCEIFFHTFVFQFYCLQFTLFPRHFHLIYILKVVDTQIF